MSAVKSLQRQEDILRALHKRDPAVGFVGCSRLKLVAFDFTKHTEVRNMRCTCGAALGFKLSCAGYNIRILVVEGFSTIRDYHCSICMIILQDAKWIEKIRRTKKSTIKCV